MKNRKYFIWFWVLYLITCIFIAVACQEPDCECGTITDIGTTIMGNTWVELTTDCEADKYLTDSTYYIGQSECIENLRYFNLIIKP